MRKNKLITFVAAVSLLAGTGVSVITNNQVTYAAQKSKKSTAKVAKVQIKRGAVAYTFTTKNNKITSVKPLKYKGKKMYLKSVKADAIWSTKYKNTTYYYVKVGKTPVMLRAKDAKRLNKVSIPSFNTYINNYLDSYKKAIEAIPSPFVQGKTNTNAPYLEHKDDHWSLADTPLPKDTELTILYQFDNSGTTFYRAETNDNKDIAIQKDFVDLDQSGANVLTEDQFSSANQTYQDAIKKVQAQYGVTPVVNK